MSPWLSGGGLVDDPEELGAEQLDSWVGSSRRLDALWSRQFD
jgi:hypothetical protein